MQKSISQTHNTWNSALQRHISNCKKISHLMEHYWQTRHAHAVAIFSAFLSAEGNWFSTMCSLKVWFSSSSLRPFKTALLFLPFGSTCFFVGLKITGLHFHNLDLLPVQFDTFGAAAILNLFLKKKTVISKTTLVKKNPHAQRYISK